MVAREAHVEDAHDHDTVAGVLAATDHRLATRRAPLALARGLVWQVRHPLDAAAMQRGADFLLGRHDFTTFRSAHCQARDPIKTLDRLDVSRRGAEVHVEADARSFLHHQVRSMVGCLALVGLDRWRVEDVGAALHKRDRHALGLNAPPQGLYFVEARYEDEI